MTRIVLLHALATDSGMWAGPRAALEGAGHAVLAPDLRGHGRAPLGDRLPAMSVLVDDLAAALDARGWDTAHLAGCSLGGYVALAFLARYPERVSGLALLATRAEPDEPAARERRLAFAAAMGDPGARAGLVAVAAGALVGRTTREQRPDLAARVRAVAESVDAGAVAWCQRAIAGRESGLPALAGLRGPGLSLVGAEDELVTVTEAAAAASAMPAGRLVTVPGAGHLTPLEAPSAVTGALLGLLVGVPA